MGARPRHWVPAQATGRAFFLHKPGGRRTSRVVFGGHAVWQGSRRQEHYLFQTSSRVLGLCGVGLETAPAGLSGLCSDPLLPGLPETKGGQGAGPSHLEVAVWIWTRPTFLLCNSGSTGSRRVKGLLPGVCCRSAHVRDQQADATDLERIQPPPPARETSGLSKLSDGCQQFLQHHSTENGQLDTPPSVL